MAGVYRVILALTLFLTQQADANCLVDDIQVQANFNLERYMGHWYEVRWMTIEDKKWWLQDFSRFYTPYNASAVTVDSYGRGSADADCFQFPGEMDLTDTPGKMVTYMYLDTVKTLNYWVIATDYDTYSVVYGCREQNPNGTCAVVDSWIFSRTLTMTAEVERIVDGVLTQLCLQKEDYILPEQGLDCRAALMHTTTVSASGGATAKCKAILLLTSILFIGTLLAL